MFFVVQQSGSLARLHCVAWCTDGSKPPAPGKQLAWECDLKVKRSICWGGAVLMRSKQNWCKMWRTVADTRFSRNHSFLRSYERDHGGKLLIAHEGRTSAVKHEWALNSSTRGSRVGICLHDLASVFQMPWKPKSTSVWKLPANAHFCPHLHYLLIIMRVFYQKATGSKAGQPQWDSGKSLGLLAGCFQRMSEIHAFVRLWLWI